jgi:hypothetical protein
MSQLANATPERITADAQTPQVRIFPHNTGEFPERDDLMTWLLNGLRGRGGEYHLTSADAVADLPPGSIVLFRHGNEIIGEAVVRKGKELCSGKAYAAQVTFATSSIRLYSPPVDINKIQPLVDESQIKKDLSGARPYYILNWDIYGRILKEVAEAGAFIGG